MSTLSTSSSMRIANLIRIKTLERKKLVRVLSGALDALMHSVTFFALKRIVKLNTFENQFPLLSFFCSCQSLGRAVECTFPSLSLHSQK